MSTFEFLQLCKYFTCGLFSCPLPSFTKDFPMFSPTKLFKKKMNETENLINPLTNNKFLDWSKLKVFADDEIKVTEKMKFVLEMVENIVGNGENAGYQHFLLFPQ